MKRWVLIVMGLVLAVGSFTIGDGATEVDLSVDDPSSEAIFNKDPEAGSGSCTGARCDWCCQDQCGCSNPGAGWHFTGWCGCSSIECNRECDWTQANP